MPRITTVTPAARQCQIRAAPVCPFLGLRAVASGLTCQPVAGEVGGGPPLTHPALPRRTSRWLRVTTISAGAVFPRGQHPDRGRFTGPVRPEQAEELPRRDVQADAPDSRNIPARGRIGRAQILPARLLAQPGE